MCGSFVLELDSFYEQTSDDLIAQYIHDLGPLKKSEVINVVKMLINHSNSSEEAQMKIKTVLAKMRVEFTLEGKQVPISPLTNEKLYQRIVKKYKSPWDKKYIPEEIDFNIESIPVGQRERNQCCQSLE